MLEILFNKRFENEESSTLLNESNKDISLEDILSSYNDIDKLLINPTESASKYSIWGSINPRSDDYDNYINTLMSSYFKKSLNKNIKYNTQKLIELINLAKLSEHENEHFEVNIAHKGVDVDDEIKTKDIIV